jgi:hypothetical protein
MLYTHYYKSSFVYATSIVLALISMSGIDIGLFEYVSVVLSFLAALHSLREAIPDTYTQKQTILYLSLYPWSAYLFLARKIYSSFTHLYFVFKNKNTPVEFDIENVPATPPRLTYNEFRSGFVSLYLMSLTVDEILACL